MQETEATVYGPYPKILECLTICLRHWSEQFSVLLERRSPSVVIHVTALMVKFKTAAECETSETRAIDQFRLSFT